MSPCLQNAIDPAKMNGMLKVHFELRFSSNPPFEFKFENCAPTVLREKDGWCFAYMVPCVGRFSHQRCDTAKQER
jgi:hypothetical protein